MTKLFGDGRDQLCWYCTKTNEVECNWFCNRPRMPKGAKRDKDGFIVSCPNFNYSGEEKLNVSRAKAEQSLSIQEAMKKYETSRRTVYRYIDKYGNKWEEMLSAEYSRKLARAKKAEEMSHSKGQKPKRKDPFMPQVKKGRNTLDPQEAVKAQLPLHLQKNITSIKDIYI